MTTEQSGPSNEQPRLSLADLTEAIRQRECAAAASYSSLSANERAAKDLSRASKGVPEADLDQCKPGLVDAMRAAAAQGEWPIYLFGLTGIGKTCAAAAVFRSWLARSCRKNPPTFPLWTTFPEFCDRLAQIRKNGSIMVEHPSGQWWECCETDWWKRWARTDLCVIDEIGTRSDNDVRAEALWRLLDQRAGLPTIYTGNLDEAGIVQVFDERILSRLCNGTMIELVGGDRRLAGAAKRTIKI